LILIRNDVVISWNILVYCEGPVILMLLVIVNTSIITTVFDMILCT